MRGYWTEIWALIEVLAVLASVVRGIVLYASDRPCHATFWICIAIFIVATGRRTITVRTRK